MMPNDINRYPAEEHPVTQRLQQEEFQGPLIDLDHLAAQTLYDKELQNEVLGLFHQQLLEAAAEIFRMNGDQRRALAHRLVGAARAVGAFAFGQTIEELGRDPGNAHVVDQVVGEIEALIPQLIALMSPEDGAGG